jgi:hypothetical protein
MDISENDLGLASAGCLVFFIIEFVYANPESCGWSRWTVGDGRWKKLTAANSPGLIVIA